MRPRIAVHAAGLPVAAHPRHEDHALIRAMFIEAVHGTNGAVAEVFHLDAVRPIGPSA